MKDNYEFQMEMMEREIEDSILMRNVLLGMVAIVIGVSVAIVTIVQ